MALNVKTFKHVLNILNSLDIDSPAFKIENKKVRLSGIDSSKTIVVFDEIGDVVSHPVGILSVKSIITRLNLFSEEKAVLTEETAKEGSETYTSSLEVKEGRRKTSIKTTSPTRLAVPTRTPELETAVTFSITKDTAAYLGNVFSSVKSSPGKKETLVSFRYDSASPDEVNIVVSNEFDSFSEPLKLETCEYSGASFDISYMVESFSRVLKAAAQWSDENEGRIEIFISDPSVGVSVLQVGGIQVMISPKTSTGK